mgnify:CR=1 FL=1
MKIGLHAPAIDDRGNGTVMYGDDALNVTEDVIRTLNEDYAKK